MGWGGVREECRGIKRGDPQPAAGGRVSNTEDKGDLWARGGWGCSLGFFQKDATQTDRARGEKLRRGGARSFFLGGGGARISPGKKEDRVGGHGQARVFWGARRQRQASLSCLPLWSEVGFVCLFLFFFCAARPVAAAGPARGRAVPTRVMRRARRNAPRCGGGVRACGGGPR